MEKLPSVDVKQSQAVAAFVRPLLSAQDALRTHAEVTAFVKSTLKPGTHYMKIQGKEALKKEGAEFLSSACGLHPNFEIIDKEVDHDRKNEYQDKYKGKSISHGLYRYVLRCTLSDNAGRFVASGVGSCSTMESKYISRPRDVENTVLKMAAKRAQVAATLTALGISHEFTQDIDDNPEAFGFQDRDTAPPRQKAKPVQKSTPVVFDRENQEHLDLLQRFIDTKAANLSPENQLAVADELNGKEWRQSNIIPAFKSVGVELS